MRYQVGWLTISSCIVLMCPSACQNSDVPAPASSDLTGSTASVDQRSYRLGGIGAFAEMVGAGVKKLALSAAMPAAEMNALIDEARAIAESNGAEVHLETDFLVTDLFAAEITEGMHVLLIYKGQTLQDYMDLKERKQHLVEEGTYEGDARAEIAREMGRLLSYPEDKITSLLTSQPGESS
jgi:hypothetical protein